jgi:predicted DNA-binding transcriptional regulator AlpA
MPVDAHEKFLLCDKEAAALLGIGRTLLWGLHNSGRLPLPVKLGRRTLWNFEELKAWTAAGCPARQKWEILKGL